MVTEDNGRDVDDVILGAKPILDKLASTVEHLETMTGPKLDQAASDAVTATGRLAQLEDIVLGLEDTLSAQVSTLSRTASRLEDVAAQLEAAVTPAAKLLAKLQGVLAERGAEVKRSAPGQVKKLERRVVGGNTRCSCGHWKTSHVRDAERRPSRCGRCECVIFSRERPPVIVSDPCRCGHDLVDHDGNGRCNAIRRSCVCSAFTPVSTKGRLTMAQLSVLKALEARGRGRCVHRDDLAAATGNRIQPQSMSPVIFCIERSTGRRIIAARDIWGYKLGRFRYMLEGEAPGRPALDPRHELSAKQVARALGVASGIIAMLCRKDVIPARKMGDGSKGFQWRIPRAAIGWIKEVLG